MGRLEIRKPRKAARTGSLAFFTAGKRGEKGKAAENREERGRWEIE